MSSGLACVWFVFNTGDHSYVLKQGRHLFWSSFLGFRKHWFIRVLGITHRHIQIYTRIHTLQHHSTPVHIYIYICKCIYIYIFVYIYIWYMRANPVFAVGWNGKTTVGFYWFSDSSYAEKEQNAISWNSSIQVFLRFTTASVASLPGRRLSGIIWLSLPSTPKLLLQTVCLYPTFSVTQVQIQHHSIPLAPLLPRPCKCWRPGPHHGNASTEESQERHIIDVLTSREESQERHIIDVLTSTEESQERHIIDVLTSREESQERNIIGRHGKNNCMPPHPTPQPPRNKTIKTPTSKNRQFCAPANENAMNSLCNVKKETAPATRNGHAQIHWWQQVKMTHFSAWKGTDDDGDKAPPLTKHEIMKDPKRRKNERFCAHANENATTVFLQRQKTRRLPRKINMLKFIGGRRSKCTFFSLTIENIRVSLAREENFKRDQWQF